jgi:hypothetical protein
MKKLKQLMISNRDGRSPTLRQSIESQTQVQSRTLRPPAFRESKTGFVFS